MVRIRGVAIIGTARYVQERFGEEALARVFAAVSPETRDLLGTRGEKVIESGWYDAGALAGFTRHADRLLGTGDLALARAVGKELAFRDMGRFFRWLFKLAGPKTLFTRASSVWSNYYDTGRYVVESVEEGRASLRVEGWGASEPVLCRRLEGWIERACEMTLGEGVRPTIRETHHHHRDASVTEGPFCRFLAEW